MYFLSLILIIPYLVLLLGFYRSLLKLRSFKVSREPATFVSVILPCRNEQANLPSVLRSISMQDYPAHLFELIIVNDNSTDRTSDILDELRYIAGITVVNNKGSGKKQALRTGIAVAKGTLIITTDADCDMGKQWIRTIAAFYEINRPRMIICPVQIEPANGFSGKFQQLEFLSLQGITAGSAVSEEATMCNGANLAFKREEYMSHADDLHYEINSGDDIFLLHALKRERRSGILWLESPEAMVTTKPAPTLATFFNQRSRWISKGKAFKDRFTIILGITTLVAVLLQISAFLFAIINPSFTGLFILILLFKSIPDYLIVHNTASRYGKRKLTRFFPAAELMYPFYVLSVIFWSVVLPMKRKVNSPFPKGI